MKNFFLKNIFIPAILFFISWGAVSSLGYAKKGDTPSTDFMKFHNIDKVSKYAKGNKAIVAVLDWCFDMSEEAKKKYLFPTSMIPDQNIGEIEVWHGEWMARIIHRIAPDAKIIPIRCRPDNIEVNGKTINKRAYIKYLIKGIKYAADKGAIAITNSMGPVKESLELREAIDYAWKKGSVFINVHPEYKSIKDKKYIWVKGGELNPKIIHSGVVSVPDYPGEPDLGRELFTWPYDIKPVFKDGWGYSNGPPIIAGIIALMKGEKPELKPEEIKSILIETAFQKDGYLIPDARAALVKIKKQRWEK